MPASVFISAGEASGDTYGAQLIAAARKVKANLDFFGLGGDRMKSAGCELVTESRQVAVVGLAEVVKHLPGIYGEFRKILREVDRRKPAAAVLIDFPDFNLRLAKQLHARGIPVVYFVSPQLWAWRKGRIAQIKKYVKKMLVIFPFEEQFYREQGVEVEYVGHPLADLPQPSAVPSAIPIIGLLPGSRKQELERHLPEMVKAAAMLGSDYRYLLPVASTLDRSWVQSQVAAASGGAVKIELADDARVVLASAKASIVASGTATVEAALAGNPFVVVYRVSGLSWTVGRGLVDLEHFAMVNLIAGKLVVPELIQDNFTAERVVDEMTKLLTDGPERTQMITELAEVRAKLHPASQTETAADRAARALLSIAFPSR
ncbi:MAG TPA: lipid-A-disaccharide synthase [Terriglobales bacterium]|nr:lipid-A-disaccharide synthase [Terriglobales bacterium]